ncbi:MAG: hypothetical protein ABI811_02305 [Acidobacteriota bacterium]
MNFRVALASVACFLSGAAFGQQQQPSPQYPGQVPQQYPQIPPGQNPNDPYPGGNYPPGTPLPPGTRRPQPIPVPTSRTPGPTSAPQRRDSGVVLPPARRQITTAGILRGLESRQLIIESTDHRIVWYRLADDLKLEREKFHPGDHLTVISVEDDEGRYTATSAEWVSAATSADRAQAAQSWDLPNDSIVEEKKDERPVLRRGNAPEPQTTEVRTSAEPRAPRSGPGSTRPDDPEITKARAAGAEFVESLPRFSVRENIARYVKETSRGDWRAVDVVTANLVYKDGAEQYSDIKVGRDKTNKPMEEIDGLRSTGEFGGILAEILDLDTAADFARPTTDQLRNRRAWRYKFEVTRERSRWRILSPSQHYYTGYGGTIWIDFETSRVLRLEMQARSLPSGFPFDTVEMTVDYDFIRLDSAKQFLLPTEAEALNCIRNTSVCMRNATSFRNYVKFAADSDIKFEEPK